MKQTIYYLKNSRFDYNIIYLYLAFIIRNLFLILKIGVPW